MKFIFPWDFNDRICEALDAGTQWKDMNEAVWWITSSFAETSSVAMEAQEADIADLALNATSASYAATASVALNPVIPSQLSILNLTASRGVLIGASTDNSAALYISGSPNQKLVEIEPNTGIECFQINATGQTNISNLSATGSIYGTVRRNVSSQSYAATLTTDGTLADVFRVTLTGNINLQKATASYDGQKLSWCFLQDNNGNRTITLDSSYITGSDFNVQLCGSSSKRDFLTAMYDASVDKWYVLGFVRNY